MSLIEGSKAALEWFKFFGERRRKIEAIDKKLDSIIETISSQRDEYFADKASDVRRHILAIDSNLRVGCKMTQEQWEDILMDIKFYEDYCRDHPTYPNERAIYAIKNIKANYHKAIDEKGFLE